MTVLVTFHQILFQEQTEGFVHYFRQPKLCRNCGESGHLAMCCEKVFCSNCKENGHLVQNCIARRHCNLCGSCSFRDCPCSFANRAK